MQEQSPRSTSPFGPAFVAVLTIVAIVAATMAYVVVRRVITAESTAAGATDDAASRDTGDPTGASPGGPSPVGTESTPPGRACPEITAEAVRQSKLPGRLTLLLYVKGAPPAPGQPGAEVWICADADGTLIYQGHRLSGPFRAARSDDTLLLGRGILGSVEPEGTGFVATNPRDPDRPNDPRRTEYHVSRSGISQIHWPSRATTVYPALTTEPPT